MRHFFMLTNSGAFAESIRRAMPLCCLLLGWAITFPGEASAEPAEPVTEATRKALDLAGAFANDGYKLRDGRWEITLEKDKPRILAVHLYGGNEYWFCAATEPASDKISVDVFDETGTIIDGEKYKDGGRAAAGAIPAYSGMYYVRLKLEADEPSHATLVYSYK
jgi:hypothetical protein